MRHDGIGIGGGISTVPSSATDIARGRRKVVVVDAGSFRNRFAVRFPRLSMQDRRPLDIASSAVVRTGANGMTRLPDFDAAGDIARFPLASARTRMAACRSASRSVVRSCSAEGR